MTHPLLDVELDPDASTSLSVQIVDAITGLIATGSMSAGDEIPGAASVAEAVGVSVATVRSAFNRLATRGLISIERGKPSRVIGEAAAKRLHGNPVTITSVGVLMPSRRTLYGPLLDGIHTAGGGGTMSLVADARDDPTRAMRYVRRLAETGVGGLISVGRALPDEYGTAIAHRGPPIVYVDWDESPDPWVRFDRFAASLTATTHLLEHGHDRIALVVPDPSRSPGSAIRDGYREALKAAGIDPDPSLEINAPVYSYGAGRQAADAVAACRPSAVFVGSDTIGAGVHASLAERGIKLGVDLALIGLGGLEVGRLLTPTMSTIALPRFAAGRTAMAMLSTLASGEDPKPALLQGSLVARRSCGCEA